MLRETVPPTPALDDSARRVLAVRLDNIGDIVMLGPSLRALDEALPDASITLLCSPGGAQVAPLLPWIDDLIVHRAVWQDAQGTMALDPARELGFIEALRERSFDAAFIFTSFSQSAYPPAYACYLAGIPIRVGAAEAFGGSVLSPALKPVPWEAHGVDRNLHLVESMGIPVRDRNLELRLPAGVDDGVARLLAARGIASGQPFIVLAPGASCSARRYEPSRFGTVSRHLHGATGWPIVVVGNERDRGVAAQMASAARLPSEALVDLVGHTTVPELSAVIARSSLLIGNDSGPMHIADAFARPQVITFSGTDLESQWRPHQSPTSLLRVPTPCAPCYRFECPYANACLDIAPEQVVAEALQLLEMASHSPADTNDQRPNGGVDATTDPDLARPRELPVLPGAGPP